MIKNWKLVLAGVAVSAALAAAWGWRTEIKAVARAEEHVETLRASLEASKQVEDQLRDEIEVRDKIAQQSKDKAEQLDRDLQEARSLIEQGASDENEPYSECRDVVLPDAIRAGLLEYAGDGED